jgi:metal-sulfur cluster biosynthetic enzyme
VKGQRQSAEIVDTLTGVWNAECSWLVGCERIIADAMPLRMELIAKERSMPIDREQILEALRQCYDPEIPINIVDLGLIYDVEHDDAGNVTVKMTLTTQGCPSALAIPDQVRSQIAAIAEVRDVKVDIVWEPAWNPSMISPNGRQALGLEV